MKAKSSIDAMPRRSPLSSQAMTELDFHASGFMVKVEGAWTNAALVQFRHYLGLRYLSPTEDELMESLERAKQKYFSGSSHLFLCGAQPCCKALGFDASAATLLEAGRRTGLPISKTGCQGQCKHAGVLSLRVGNRNQMFARVTSDAPWRAVLAFAKAAVQAGSLSINPDGVEQFFHDPVHDHGKPDDRLKSLRFLLGHFRGEGRFAMNNYTFQKEVIGNLEAGGRFMTLRMNASYPLADGRRDTHSALVIVGVNHTARSFGGCAYTDGGTIREYEVAQHGHALQFADAPPDHARRWKRARKTIQPTPEGFEEHLEVDAGQGFISYYKVHMRKITAV